MRFAFNIFKVTLFTIFFLAVYHGGPPQAGLGRVVQAADVAGLQDQLENGLRTKRPQDIRFLKLVVRNVQLGRLALKDVKGVLNWARGKRPHPFVYFQVAMRQVARKKGVIL